MGDLLLLNISFLLAHNLRFEDEIIFDERYRALVIIFNLLWILIAFGVNIYDIQRTTSLEKVVVNLLKAVIFHILLVFALIFSLKGYYFSRLHLLITYSFFAVAVFGWRMLVLYLLKRYRQSGYNYRKVVVAGAGKVGEQITEFFENHNDHGYHLIGVFDNSERARMPVNGNLKDIELFCLENEVDEIFCALPLSERKQIRKLVTFADNNMIRFRVVPDFGGFPYRRVNMEFFGATPVLTVRKEPLESLYNRFIKRSFDVVFSLIVIIFVLSWLVPILAVLIKLDSRGPVFFKQLRSGKDNREFWCYKFRTMKENKEAHAKQATKDDDRITPLGSFLRKTSLDELPQFFNVLKGDMSVVGPRPHMLKHTTEYSAIIDKFMVRHLVKPGITGAAQVKGHRGETKDPKQMEMRVRADVWYIENWSFLLDLKLIFLTAFNIFRGEENAF